MAIETQLAQALLNREPLLERWMEALRRRSWLLARAAAAADGGPAPIELVRERAGAFLEALSLALQARSAGADADAPERARPTLDVGSPAFREPIQILAFTAGWLAGRGLPVGDALALVHALEDVLGLPLRRFFEALAVVVSEAYCSALRQREQARYRDAMEKAQLVCTPHPRLPCLFLVGDPDLQALDDCLGRLLMLVLMREAPAFIVEGSALFKSEPVFESVATHLGEEKRLSARGILAGLSPELCDKLGRRHGRLSFHQDLSEAMAEAAAALGLSWPTTHLF